MLRSIKRNASRKSHLDGEQAMYDLICAGFGPASLAIAIALRDRGTQARVLYLERQRQFRWHGGMLIPNARMQISFLKDLATLRDPRSHFTFLNYLKKKNRLVAFTNLSTFLPLREEYNDYLTWCASHFQDDVYYGQETLDIYPIAGKSGSVESWGVLSRDVDTEEETTLRARHVVIAVGGKPKVPAVLPKPSPKCQIIHSSSYSHIIPTVLAGQGQNRNVAVIGGGQSAAEIFNDLQSRFRDVKVTLYTSDSALRPSDDSPFVNEIFDPHRVNEFFNLPTQAQRHSLDRNKNTNYSVIRPELLDDLYELMYHQRLREPDETEWQHKIITCREVVGHEETTDSGTRLRLRDTMHNAISLSDTSFDLIIASTGYLRNAHEAMLDSTKALLQTDDFEVGRDYRIKYRQNAVSDDCGVWLQGCCQDTHGLSDTLLSILAVRGDEIVNSIFPRQADGAHVPKVRKGVAM